MILSPNSSTQFAQSSTLTFHVKSLRYSDQDQVDYITLIILETRCEVDMNATTMITPFEKEQSLECILHYVIVLHFRIVCANYDTMGCGIFKGGVTKLKRFVHKNQHTQRKLLNFEFWIYGKLSKSAKT